MGVATYLDRDDGGPSSSLLAEQVLKARLVLVSHHLKMQAFARDAA